MLLLNVHVAFRLCRLLRLCWRAIVLLVLLPLLLLLLQLTLQQRELVCDALQAGHAGVRCCWWWWWW
jgi:hypothetical protein